MNNIGIVETMFVIPYGLKNSLITVIINENQEYKLFFKTPFLFGVVNYVYIKLNV